MVATDTCYNEVAASNKAPARAHVALSIGSMAKLVRQQSAKLVSLVRVQLLPPAYLTVTAVLVRNFDI